MPGAFFATQLRSRGTWTAEELPPRWEKAGAAALVARRRIPAPIRALPLLPLGTVLGTRLGWKPLGYLFDIGFTRDVWMHRVDIARAVGAPLVLTAEHDGRIVADMVLEWTQLHDLEFELDLTGPAGGVFTSGTGGERLQIDAIELVWILSGRGEAPETGLLAHPLPL